MSEVKIFVDAVEFVEVQFPSFAVIGEEDKYPFIRSVVTQVGSKYKQTVRRYPCLRFNGKYYAPKPEKQ